ncbi:peptidylprolyl isomerase [Kordiimonas aquimaris]|uniref:peptidylprolyl isomerase n=1 Tax=Kordiimonas aquimaris TaxID=707591 RepID=UPI0021CECF05|nr:peptidylprolyl isomerase [Kordiimonas aquimaris]
MTKLFKEPLLQFVLGGALLYAALSLFAPDEGAEDDPLFIYLDEGRLLTYLQYQDKAFDTDQARRILDGLNEKTRQQLENEYIRDEIMVREALALGLDQNDDVIDQRLIQKMDFIFQGFAEPDQSISEMELAAYFDANKVTYTTDAEATFTHVFFNTNEQTLAEATTKATKALETLQTNNVPFEDAGKYGDRFYFLKNYVNRPERMIKTHFGETTAAEIFNPKAFDTWLGPLQSEYGLHLIMVRGVKAAQIPELSEITDQVQSDLLRERRDAVRRAAFEKVAQKYTVQYATDK